MKKEDLLNEDFLKQFKTGKELNEFLSQLQKRGIEKILEGELYSYFGYEKSQKSENNNNRNGYSEKKVRTFYGESNCLVLK
jgi:transposase-like protein